MTIEDVLSPDTCVCLTDEGLVLEGLREDMLETLVSKVQGNRCWGHRLEEWDACWTGTENGAGLWCNCGERISWWSFTMMLSASTSAPVTQMKTDP
ncbi:g patch domain and kow [Lynx pardinus]|uniref:G patch domain and kow n=1 Tax=Lynx pardinus TaxID=191816 RepID=A0A485MVD1_LYNPA|nr:g patch domain and kow [Lynx pardinus]